MKPLRVCLIGKYLYPLDTRTKQQAQILEEYGIHTSIFCKGQANQQKHDKYGLIHIYKLGKEKNKLGFFGYLIETFSFGISCFLNLLIHQFTKPYNIIVVHTLPEFLVFFTIIPKLFKVPIVLDARDLTVELLLSRWPKKRMRFVKNIAVIIEKVCCNFSDFIITASDGFKGRLIQRGVKESKLMVMQNTADPLVFKPLNDGKIYQKCESNLRCIYHGTVARRFGVLEAVKAMDYIKHEIPDSQFHVYGMYDLDYKKEIKQVIKDKQLQQHVVLHGIRTIPELYEIFKTIDLGIVPYLNDDFMNLALSTKMFEYVASGVPVVASRMRSSEKIFNNTCVKYVTSGAPKELAEKIIGLFKDDVKQESLRKNAFKAYETVSGQRMAAKYIELINRLCSK